jgi:UDP-N-acetylglucosamine 2-epimerase (non-hydrolysing)
MSSPRGTKPAAETPREGSVEIAGGKDGSFHHLKTDGVVRSPRKSRVLVVAGARPNFIKIAPLMACLRPEGSEAAVETLLVHTGQHYDEAMSDLFFHQLGIPAPDVNLEVGSGKQGQQTGGIILRFEPVVEDWKPDAVVVVGDVNSTIACALVAVKLGVRVAHVEAGLRSFDRTMPEEINRLLTDAIADELFVTEPSGVTNLRREGIAENRIHLVGNVMIDSLRRFLPVAQRSGVLEKLKLSAGAAERPQPFALLTLHRPSNVDEAKKLRALLEVLAEIARELPVLFPVHPRTLGNIESFGLKSLVRTAWSPGDRGVWMVPPLGYLEFLHLMSKATMVLTDSGGIQEETTALGVPCLTLRENTERPITVDQGTNTLVGTDPARILSAARGILAGRGKSGRVPALWDGKAAERIVSILLERLVGDQQSAEPG